MTTSVVGSSSPSSIAAELAHEGLLPAIVTGEHDEVPLPVMGQVAGELLVGTADQRVESAPLPEGPGDH